MREQIGMGLLLVLLAVSIGTAWGMRNWNEPVAGNLEQAASHSLKGDWEAARAQVLEAREQWDAHWHVTAVFADHGPMEEIDGLFAQLEVYTQAEDPVAFSAVCRELQQQIQDIVDAHQLTWWNLL